MTDDDQPCCAGPSVAKTLTCASKSKPFRSCHDSYLELWFTWCDNEFGPKPKCIICGKEVSIESLVPGTMKRNLTTKHGHLSDKPLTYFKTFE